MIFTYKKEKINFVNELLSRGFLINSNQKYSWKNIDALMEVQTEIKNGSLGINEIAEWYKTISNILSTVDF